jgi:hypothetical protein
MNVLFFAIFVEPSFQANKNIIFALQYVESFVEQRIFIAKNPKSYLIESKNFDEDQSEISKNNFISLEDLNLEKNRSVVQSSESQTQLKSIPQADNKGDDLSDSCYFDNGCESIFKLDDDVLLSIATSSSELLYLRVGKLLFADSNGNLTSTQAFGIRDSNVLCRLKVLIDEIYHFESKLVGKITGMLLELDDNEIIELITMRFELQKRCIEAIETLFDHHKLTLEEPSAVADFNTDGLTIMSPCYDDNCPSPRTVVDIESTSKYHDNKKSKQKRQRKHHKTSRRDFYQKSNEFSIC